MSKDFYLIDVLYIPDFSFNMISVSKVTKSLSCKFIFFYSDCQIQDSHSMRMIGAAKLKSWLYAMVPNDQSKLVQHYINNFFLRMILIFGI
uniref:Retrovirus-related Pol polyprotein from transposon TNT 1-94 n=1 Tax=Cajanus cajan TaxID=3821 RepID=A0A151RBR8_CAJCA|nr:hypothetical protein KK1_038632 [Cajanus cajan]